MAAAMMQLGGFQFGLDTAAYQDLTREAEYRWPAQELFGQAPALQYTGPGGESMTLPGVIYPEFRGGLGQLDDMRALAGGGELLPLVDGAGNSLGQWAIVKVDEKQSAFIQGGAPLKIEFTLSLKRAPDPEPTTTVAGIPAAAGIANGTGVAIPSGAASALAAVRGVATSVAHAAKTIAATLTSVQATVQSAVAPYAAIAHETLGAVTRTLGVVGELQSVANRTLSTLGIAPTSINALLGADNLATRANALLSHVTSASAILSTSSANLAALSSVPPSATSAMRAAQASVDSAVTLTRQTATQAAAAKGFPNG